MQTALERKAFVVQRTLSVSVENKLGVPLTRDRNDSGSSRPQIVEATTSYKGDIQWVANILFKGALPLTIADAASKGAGGVIALLIARYFGPMQFGQYATALSFCGMFMLITGIGFEQEFTRRGSTDKNNIPSTLSLSLFSLGITSAAGYSLMTIFLLLSSFPREIIVFDLILGIMFIASSIQLPFRHLYLMLRKSHVTATIQTIATATVFALTLFVIYMRESLKFIVVSQSLVAIGVCVAWFWWTPKKYFDFRISTRAVIDFFRKSTLFGISNMIWVAYFNFDVFLLSLLRTETEVGIYAGVYRIIAINYILGFAVANTFTPILFEKFESDRRDYGKVSRKLVTTMAIIGLLTSLILYGTSDWLVPMIIGNTYREGAVIARILSIAVVFRLINFGLCEILTTGKRQKARVSVEMALLVTNMALIGILVPSYGGVGAAIATVGAEVVLFSTGVLACRTYGLFGKGGIGTHLE